MHPRYVTGLHVKLKNCLKKEEVAQQVYELIILAVPRVDTASTDWLLQWQMISFPFPDLPQICCCNYNGTISFMAMDLLRRLSHSIIVGTIETQNMHLPEVSDVNAPPGAWSPSIDIINMSFQVRRNVLHHVRSALKDALMRIWCQGILTSFASKSFTLRMSSQVLLHV